MSDQITINCHTCGKDLSHLRGNNWNIKKHEDTCRDKKANPQKGTKRAGSNQNLITGFFHKKSRSETKNKSNSNQSNQSEDQSPSATPIENESPSVTPTDQQSPSATPTNNQSPSATPTENESPSVTPTDHQSPSATPTNNQSPSATPTENESPSATPTNNQSPSATPTNNQSPSATLTENQSPSTNCHDNKNSESNIRLPIIDLEQYSNEKCPGFTPKLNGNVFTDFPFQTLNDSPDIVFENKALHSRECMANNYIVSSESKTNINRGCEMLQYSNKMNTLIERANKEWSSSDLLQVNNKYLTNRQLIDKANDIQSEKRALRLKYMKLNYKHTRLNETIKLHERFMKLVAENNVPRLQQLVAVALKHNRSISYITRKLMDAIDGIYSPRPTECQKDLAFLVLKLGGPSLLDILFRANILPSVSTAYKIAKECKPINTAVNVSVKDSFESNTAIPKESSTAISLKMDETYIKPSLEYNPRDNKVYGVCYQHGKHQDLRLNTFEDCEVLEKDVKNSILHIPKECLVAGVASMNEKSKFQPVVMWPTCNKKDQIGTKQLINDINQALFDLHGTYLMNICTDGDSTRRQIAHSIMQYEIPAENQILRFVEDLPHVDTQLGKHQETFNFDPKHLSKRAWCMMLKDKVEIDGVVITRNSLEKLFGEEGRALLYPKDKQNVPSATNFILLFDKKVRDDLPYSLLPIKTHLLMLSKVFMGIICLYAFVDQTLEDQLTQVSTAAYLLFFLYRKFQTKLMPSQLYHDLQNTFLDTLYCCIKGKIYFPEKPFYSVLNGTDMAERFFGNTRIQYRGNDMSYLDFTNAARSIAACDDILTNKHPEWAKQSRVQRRIALDYSNPAEWKEENLKPGQADIESSWNSGYNKAKALVLQAKMFPMDELDIMTTLKCPITSSITVGVSESNKTDWSREEEVRFYCTYYTYDMEQLFVISVSLKYV